MSFLYILEINRLSVVSFAIIYSRSEGCLLILFIVSFAVSPVQFSHSVVSDSLWPHELQHTRPPCPSPTPRVHSNSRPLSRWCHPAISSSVVPFSSCPQFLPASESFPISQLFSWGGQSTGVSALASFLPKNTQGRSRIVAPKRQQHDPRKVEMILHSSTQKKGGFPGGSVVKNIPANAGDTILIPGLGRYPGGGNGNLGNPMNRGA